MLACFSKLFTLFLSKLQKMQYLHCIVKFQLRKLGCALTWYKNAIPQLQNCVALQLNQKVHCGSCAVLQKFKELNCEFCAALKLVEKIAGFVALRFWYNVIRALLCGFPKSLEINADLKIALKSRL